MRTRAHDRLTPALLERITATTRAGCIAEPDDVAGCAFLPASDGARYVTGQIELDLVVAIAAGWAGPIREAQ